MSSLNAEDWLHFCGCKHVGFLDVEGDKLTVSNVETHVTRSTTLVGGALLVFRPPFRLAVDVLEHFLPTRLLLLDVISDVRFIS